MSRRDVASLTGTNALSGRAAGLVKRALCAGTYTCGRSFDESGRIYLAMPDVRAFGELLSLWQR